MKLVVGFVLNRAGDAGVMAGIDPSPRHQCHGQIRCPRLVVGVGGKASDSSARSSVSTSDVIGLPRDLSSAYMTWRDSYPTLRLVSSRGIHRPCEVVEVTACLFVRSGRPRY